MDPETEGGSLENSTNIVPGDQIDQSRGFKPQKDVSPNHIAPSGQNSASNSDSGIEVEIASGGNRGNPANQNLRNVNQSDSRKSRLGNYEEYGERKTRRSDRSPRPETKMSSYNPGNEFALGHNSRAKSRGQSHDPQYRQPVHIYEERVDFRSNAKSRIHSLDNLSYQGTEHPNFKVFTQKIDFRSKAQSKLDTHSSLSYRSQRPLVVIYNEKLNFGKKAKPKVSSFDNINFRSSKHDIKIVNEPLKVKAKPKINSFENLNYSPRKIEHHVVNHRANWFTPGKLSTKRDDYLFYPSISNANPIPLKTNRNLKKSEAAANECCQEAEETFGTYFLSPRSKIRKAKSRVGYHEELFRNNKKVHFVNDDELAAHHRAKFEQQTRNTRHHFQAIREESSRNSDTTMTPRELKTRHGFSRPVVTSTDPFRQYVDEAQETLEKKSGRETKMNKREILPRIKTESEQDDPRSESDQLSSSNQFTPRAENIQPEVTERIYDAIEEKSAAPMKLSDQIVNYEISNEIRAETMQEDSRTFQGADPEEFLKEQLEIMQKEVNSFTEQEKDDDDLTDPKTQNEKRQKTSESSLNSVSNNVNDLNNNELINGKTLEKADVFDQNDEKNSSNKTEKDISGQITSRNIAEIDKSRDKADSNLDVNEPMTSSSKEKLSDTEMEKDQIETENHNDSVHEKAAAIPSKDFQENGPNFPESEKSTLAENAANTVTETPEKTAELS